MFRTIVKFAITFSAALTCTGVAVAGTIPLMWVGKDSTTLGVCQGDCDVDADCPGNSVCVQRSNGKPVDVYGCSTGDSFSALRKDTDYCSNGLAHTVSVTGTIPLMWVGKDSATLGVCQGDCDVDADCPGNSVCVQRSNGKPVDVYGCSTGDSFSALRKDTDYCSNGLAHTGYVSTIGGSTVVAGTIPLMWVGKDSTTLGVCQGDCDVDADCPGNSVCVQRTNGEPVDVYGCSTGDSFSALRKDTDYCSNGLVHPESVATGQACRWVCILNWLFIFVALASHAVW